MFKKTLFSLCLLAATASSSAFASYASIAYNFSARHWGENHGATTLFLSEEGALASCGGGCEVVGWVREGYVALATGSTGWGSASSNFSLADAENRALANCSARSANCQIAVWASGF
jgi:hypothetical protein